MEYLKEVQWVLNLPELKIVKPLDTCWLAHEPGALGISKAMCKPFAVCAMYLLDYALPQVAKLSKCFHAEKIYLTAVAPLVDALSICWMMLHYQRQPGY